MRFSHAFLLNFVGREIILLFSVFNTVILARCLGTEGMGTYALVIAAAYLMAQAGTLGFNYSNNYLAAQKPELAGLLATQSIVPVFLVGALLGPILLWAPQWTDFAFADVPRGARVFAGAGAVLIILNLNLGSIFAGLRRYRRFNVVNSVATVGTAVSNLVLVGILGMRMLIPLYVWLAWNLLSIVAALVLLLPHAAPALRLDFGLLRQSLSVGARALIVTVMAFAGFRGILFLINKDLGRSLLGCYAIAVPISELLMHVPATLGAIVFNDAAAGEGGARRTARILRLHLLVSGLVGAALIAVAPEFLRLVFGEKYEASIVPMRILIPGYYFWGIWALTSAHLSGRSGYPLSIVFLSSVSGILTLVLAAAWIPAHALAGAAAAWSLSAFIVGMLSVVLFVRDAQGMIRTGDLVPCFSDVREGWELLRSRFKSA